MAEYVIAEYLRFSLDEAKSECTSIENQRTIVSRHIAELNIPDVRIIEFVDNGFSGTNFERPGVQQLLELVREGKINCIIVKDFSRFGRNAIESGYFIERIFPLFRVRFISVTDSFDSSNYEGDTGGMDVALKLLVHEQYSRDLSVKIKTAKRARALNGEYIVKNCVFGYKKAGKNLVVDEPAAGTVRLIFNMAAQGDSLASIVAKLYDDRHPTPKEYKNQTHSGSASDLSCLWDKTVILSMLSNEQYIGTYVAGKSKSIEIGSGRSVPVDESEWIKIPDHHPAIIIKPVFEAVCKKTNNSEVHPRTKRQKTYERYRHNEHILKGRVFCGHCGHAMTISSTKNAAFHCSHTRVAPDTECYRLRVLSSELESKIMERVLIQAQAILDGTSDTKPQLGGYDEHLSQINDAKCALYERFVLGNISTNDYKLQKESLDSDYFKTKQARDTFIKESSKRSLVENRRAVAEEAIKERKLTHQVVDTLIDKILVYRDNRIEISWKQE